MPNNSPESGVREIILINIAGADRPGVTSSLTSILAQFDVNVLDIGLVVPGASHT